MDNYELLSISKALIPSFKVLKIVDSSSIANIVNAIKGSQPAMIKLTVKGGNQHQYECTFKEDEAPNFFLVFPPDTLPDGIALKAEHLVSIAQKSSSLSLNTSIIERQNDTLRLKANGTLDPASLREYFRINTSTKIVASYRTNSQHSSSADWTISGQTQDISGSGVLALFGDEPKNKNHIIVEILLPHQNVTINAVSHIVHKKRLRNGRWQVSFHFDTISTKHRDSVITYLLGVQRQQLRDNVRAWDE
ncbi:PilZ domain-containing protein [Desulfopila inferna]|uniref:PilZ domain-containing protein n=1 Tax=Desulfopila inferna TaxID=468528 RepID=UPI00196688AE|nr:PilZ domain-containing protein [Desulfopila inferna]MBM9603020.1 PilZ domain-containing protein [Desulfopila inferna]